MSREPKASEAQTGQEEQIYIALTPGLGEIVQNWVVKTVADLPPHKLDQAELAALARASVETMAARALGENERPWAALETLTSGWLVQRERGTRPGALTTEEYQRFVRFVLEGLAQSVQPETRAELAEMCAPLVQDTSDTLPDGRNVADVLREDPLYFAREHLRASL